MRLEALEYLVAVVKTRPAGRQLQAGVTAARAILEATKPADRKAEGDPLEQLSDEELTRLAAEASVALRETVQ